MKNPTVSFPIFVKFSHFKLCSSGSGPEFNPQLRGGGGKERRSPCFALILEAKTPLQGPQSGASKRLIILL
jgi:hypothetical protein